MDEFIYNLISNNKIKFQAGNFYIFGFSNNALTLTNVTTLFHILKIKYGNSVNEILKKLGEKQLKAIAKATLHSSVPPVNTEEINLLLKYLSLFGYGNIKIVSINNSSKEIVFQLKNSPFCSMYLKLFQVQKEGVNALVEGMCRGLAELIFNCEMESKETTCIAQHRECCYIITNKGQKKEYDLILSKYTNDIFLKTMKEQKLSKSSAELIKKVVGHNMIEWKNGVFSIWYVPGFIFPTLSLVFLIKSLEEKFGKEINNLFYHLARVQSREAVILQVQTYGFSKDEKLLRSIVEHSELTGFGVPELEKVDFKKKVIIMKHFYNPYAIHIKEVFGKSDVAVDYYVSGLIAGTAEGFFDLPMEAKEALCVAKGNTHCVHEVTELRAKTNYRIDKKCLDIIEEKINPKNFIL